MRFDKRLLLPARFSDTATVIVIINILVYKRHG